MFEISAHKDTGNVSIFEQFFLWESIQDGVFYNSDLSSPTIEQNQVHKFVQCISTKI